MNSKLSAPFLIFPNGVFFMINFKSILFSLLCFTQAAVACEVVWVADNTFNAERGYHEKIGGMPWPESCKAFQTMIRNENVGLVLTLTEKDLPDSFFEGLDAVERMHVPSEALNSIHLFDIKKFIEKTRDVFACNKTVVVHCQEGCRRTGEVLACWLMSEFGMNEDDALKHLAQCHRRYESLRKEMLMFVMLFARSLGTRPSLPEDGSMHQSGDAIDSVSGDGMRDGGRSVPPILPSEEEKR